MLVPAFVVERHAGLLDFWAVLEGLPEAAIEAAFRRADIPSLARAHLADELAVQARQCHALLRDAIAAGDWQPYHDEVRALAARCAALGVRFASWYAVAEALRQLLLPVLVEAYAATPPRLAEAIEVAQACLDLSMVAIAEQYLDTSHLNQVRMLVDADRRSLEDRFRALAGATPDAIVTADHLGRITYVNHATEALFGRSAVALLGQPLTMLMPERLREAHARGLARYLSTREARVLGRTLEMPALRSDGTEITIELSITTWAARSETSFAAIIRDISERKRIAAAFEQHARLLENTNRELEALCDSVAHDLRAPLHGVTEGVQTLLEDHADEVTGDAAAQLARIQGHARRIASLLDALLGLAQLSRGELALQRVDLSALARAAVARHAAAEPARTVAVEIADGLLATADPGLARTLLENLIGGAWKLTARAPSPRIAVGADGETFFVRHNGGDRAGLEHARPGEPSAPHAADELPGTGIALATAQRIVHRHGGRIRVDTQGSVCTLLFTLSAAATDATPLAAAARTEPPYRGDQ